MSNTPITHLQTMQQKQPEATEKTIYILFVQLINQEHFHLL